MREVRRSTLPAAVLAAVLLAAGCGGGDDGSSRSSPAATTAPAPGASPSFNDADTMFAQMMIPHHEEAVEMAELARTRAADSEVKELAARIATVQAAEIETMKGWLDTWGAEQPSGDDMGHDMSGGMPGAMSDEDMAKLESAQGPAFDSLWLTLMTVHHEGALTMAEEEIADGVNVDAGRFAQQVIDDQKAEIETMKAIQARL